MPRSPDSPTDTYLDVLRTLGVTDAALRRHHDAGPETSLRVAIDADRGSPTADLLSAFEATGRLFDLRDGLAPDDADRLTATFARFGLRIDCAESDDGNDADADTDDDLELLVTDDVTGETERIPTATDSEAVLATLREELPGTDAIAFAELLDGRHLVADARELDALARRYGPRIQPFDDPLLVPEDAIAVEDREGSAASAETAPSIEDSVPTPADSGSTPTPTPTSESSTPPAESSTSTTGTPTPATSDADESFGEFVSAVDDSAAEAVEAALSDGEPETHTIEGDGEDVAAASTATIGGGPRRTVSTSGIDEVFDQLESSAPDDGSASTTTQTMSESSDPPTDPSASTDDATTTPNGLTGGPTRTVSSTSADDILEQATGDSDFESIAAEEGDADPDAVLADAEEVPSAFEDAEIATEPAPGEVESTPASDAATTSEAEQPETATQGPAGAADVPPGDPAAASASEGSTEEAAAATPVDGDDVAEAGDTAETDDAAAADPATPMPPAEEVGDDAQASTLDDDLLEDDVELRRGSESVDGPTAPDDGIDVDPDESADADGPLAAAGGVSPNAASGESEPEIDEGTSSAQGSVSASSDAAAPDASGVEPGDVDESAESDDAGLVGRITSTIFGR